MGEIGGRADQGGEKEVRLCATFYEARLWARESRPRMVGKTTHRERRGGGEKTRVDKKK